MTDTSKLRDAVVEAARRLDEARRTGRIDSRPADAIRMALAALDAAERQPEAKMTLEERFKRSSRYLVGFEAPYLPEREFMAEAREIEIQALKEARKLIAFDGSDACIRALDNLIASRRRSNP